MKTAYMPNDNSFSSWLRMADDFRRHIVVLSSEHDTNGIIVVALPIARRLEKKYDEMPLHRLHKNPTFVQNVHRRSLEVVGQTFSTIPPLDAL